MLINFIIGGGCLIVGFLTGASACISSVEKRFEQWAVERGCKNTPDYWHIKDFILNPANWK